MIDSLIRWAFTSATQRMEVPDCVSDCLMIASLIRLIASLIRWAFTSATQRMEVLEDDTFLGTSGDRTLFMIQLNTGFDIKAFSFFPGQDEV